MAAWLFSLICLLVPSPLALAATTTPVLDYAIPNGHFYREANGQGGAGASGFAVTDDAGIPFWSAFRAAGGVSALGYPASQRFVASGFTEQVFQKAVLQWNSGRVDYLNVLDVLHDAGKDGWLAAAWMTPPPASTAADSGLSWPQVVARHRALLDGNAALRAAYFAVPDPLQRYGLPMTAPTEEGPALVVRCQRAVLQLWQQPEPWAAEGTVTVANSGDILKASGLLPATALLPAPAPTAAPFTYVALGASDAAGDGASSPANGYVALLAAKLAARYPDEHTVNLGIPGATTAQVVAQEGSQLASLRPTLVTITVGPNDLLRSVPADQFQSELDELLTQARQSGAQVVALANLPDVALAPAVPALLKPEAHDAVLAYNQVIAREAQSKGAILVDLYDPSEQLLPAHPELISADGFHPSDAGYAYYASFFWAAVAPALP